MYVYVYVYIYIYIFAVYAAILSPKPQLWRITPTTDLLNPAWSQLLGIQSALSRHALRSTQALQFRAREPRVRQPGKAPIYHTEHPKHRKVKSDWNHDRFICLPLRLLLSIYIYIIHTYVHTWKDTYICIYIYMLAPPQSQCLNGCDWDRWCMPASRQIRTG